MRSFAYTRSRALNEAISALAAAPDHDAVRPLAGGTDLLTLMKHEIVSPSRLLDIKQLADLSGTIEVTESGVQFGALTKLAAIESHPLLRRDYTALADAAAIAATPQLRNMATIGGNLLQRPRRWYYRHPDLDCWLKGGESCPARDGENSAHAIFATETQESPCVAVHPSDPAVALLLLDARVVIRGTAGERMMAVADLFAFPTEHRRRETTLDADELIVSIAIPRPRDGTRSTYLKAMDRKVWGFALVGVAASARIDSGVIAEASLVLGGVAPIPWSVTGVSEVLVGQTPTHELCSRVADIALASAKPLEHNTYKVTIAKALIREAVAATAGVSPTR